MDKSAFVDVGNLQGDQGVPEGRVVRTDIAEGSGRRSDGELTRFLNIARGSAAELEYHLLLARDLELLSDITHGLLAKQTDEVQRMLTSLIQQVQPVQLVKKAAAR
jgi:four helix bundle protein